jgi:hypothetical protein
VGAGGKEGRKRFFLKKEAKTFAVLSRTRDRSVIAINRREKSKSFLVLFFKKEPLPLP